MTEDTLYSDESATILTKPLPDLQKCSICGKEWTSLTLIVVDGHSATFCDDCYNRGVLWAIREAYKQSRKERR